MLRLACALGALQTVADAFPAIPLVPRVRCAPQTPVASMRPPRIAAFAVAGEPGVRWTGGGGVGGAGAVCGQCRLVRQLALLDARRIVQHGDIGAQV